MEPMSVREKVTAQLTGPGGPFEIVVEDVLGEAMPVLKNRPRSLRELLATSADHGDKEYLVHEDRRITYAEHVQLVASTARALEELHGIRKGDVIVAIGGRDADTPSRALRILRSYDEGEEIEMTIMRDQSRQTIAVTVPERHNEFFYERRY